MILAGKKCDRFVVPLPREVSGQPDGTNGYEMFYLQWLFHPTEGVDLASWHRNQTEGAHSPLPISTVLFTPLAEFRSSGEWAQPHLVLTHYPDLYNIPPSSSTSVTASASNPIHHPLVLLRGEILSSPSASPLASPLPTSHLALSQSRAQLLSVALQRFYIAARPVPGETEQERIDREKRRDALDMFSRGDEKFDWEGLVGMAYGGVV
jgi:ATP synthase F1 complex assembly factor 1